MLDVTGSKADLGYILAARSVPQVMGTRTTFFGPAALITAATALVLLIRDVRTLERAQTSLPTP